MGTVSRGCKHNITHARVGKSTSAKISPSRPFIFPPLLLWRRVFNPCGSPPYQPPKPRSSPPPGISWLISTSSQSPSSLLQWISAAIAWRHTSWRIRSSWPHVPLQQSATGQNFERTDSQAAHCEGSYGETVLVLYWFRLKHALTVNAAAVQLGV